MIVDSSAILAIANGEPEAQGFSDLIEALGRVHVSAGTVLESSIVLKTEGQSFLDGWLQEADVEIVPVTAAQVTIARRAYLDFGKGSGSPARLNFGDCFSYALAKSLDQPLLFKGDDFNHTDITPAYTPDLRPN